MRNSYIVLVGEPNGKKAFGRPRCRCVNNIKIAFQGEIYVLDSFVSGMTCSCELPCSTEFKDIFNQLKKIQFVKRGGINYIKRKILYTDN
jgi:hypothetical protein